jgi:hypothetical protein
VGTKQIVIEACENIKGNVRRRWLVFVITRAEDEIPPIPRPTIMRVQLCQRTSQKHILLRSGRFGPNFVRVTDVRMWCSMPGS